MEFQREKSAKILCKGFNAFFLSSKHFKVSTRKLEDFTDTLAVFAEKFNLHGPGAVGDDLEKGLKARHLKS